MASPNFSSSSNQFSRFLSTAIAALTSETAQYILKRLLQGIITLFIASVLCFIIVELAPGDYADVIKANPKLDPQTIQLYLQQYGLEPPKIPDDLPTWLVSYIEGSLNIKNPTSLEQLPGWLATGITLAHELKKYGLWLWQVVRYFNFGQSFAYSRSVLSLLQERVFATLLLAISSIVITWAVAIPLGIIGAVKQNSGVDKSLRVLSYLGQGFPSFITALLLLIFAQIASPLFPVGDMTSLNFAELSPFAQVLDIIWHMILPTIALCVTSFAGLQRLMRGQLLDVLRQDYIQTARAKGLPEDRVIYVHALRNAINPLIVLLGFEFAGLLSGSFIAEFFFNWPGLGRLILEAVRKQDLNLVMGSLIIGAAMLIIGNLLADLLLKFVDPRIKLEDLK
jgi:peptide/nickel transport system permease protein